MKKSLLVTQTKHTQDEEYNIIAQNLLISRYCKDIFGLDVFKVSRDKENHPIILTIERENIFAYVLSIWNEAGKIVPYQLGKLTFDNNYFDGSQTQVESVGIHKAFTGKGIGTILLKAIEDIAHSEKKSSLVLDSLKDFVDLSGNNLTSEEVLSIFSEKQAYEYILNNFYDRNLYFYTTLGYVNIYDNYTFVAPMKKANPESIQLAFGFTRPTTLFECKDRFRITEKFMSNEANLREISSQPLFNISKNVLRSEDISPLSIKPTAEDLTNLDIILTKLDFFKAIYNDRIIPLTTKDKTHSTKYSDISKVAEPIRNLRTQIILPVMPTHMLYKKCQKALEEISNTEDQKQ